MKYRNKLTGMTKARPRVTAQQLTYQLWRARGRWRAARMQNETWNKMRSVQIAQCYRASIGASAKILGQGVGGGERMAQSLQVRAVENDKLNSLLFALRLPRRLHRPTRESTLQQGISSRRVGWGMGVGGVVDIRNCRTFFTL